MKLQPELLTLANLASFGFLPLADCTRHLSLRSSLGRASTWPLWQNDSVQGFSSWYAGERVIRTGMEYFKQHTPYHSSIMMDWLRPHRTLSHNFIRADQEISMQRPGPFITIAPGSRMVRRGYFRSIGSQQQAKMHAVLGVNNPALSLEWTESSSLPHPACGTLLSQSRESPVCHRNGYSSSLRGVLTPESNLQKELQPIFECSIWDMTAQMMHNMISKPPVMAKERSRCQFSVPRSDSRNEDNAHPGQRLGPRSNISASILGKLQDTAQGRKACAA